MEVPVTDSDLEKRLQDAVCVNESHLQHPWWYNLKYLLWGVVFGMVFVKAEIISWFRIQEMFRFESPLPFFHRHASAEVEVMGRRWPKGGPG